MDNQQRSLELETLARENGWSFAPTGKIPAIEKFEFQTGEKRKVERIENLIEIDEIKVFDIYWQTELKITDAFGPLAHKNMTAQNIRQQTVILFESANLQLPEFHVYPANSSGWLDKVFRRNDSSEFAKRWTVQGVAKDFLNKNLIEFYEKSDDFWTFATENLIFIYQPNLLILPSQISDWTKRISTLAKLFRSA